MLEVGDGLGWDGGAALGVEGYGVGEGLGCLVFPAGCEGDVCGNGRGEVVGVGLVGRFVPAAEDLSRQGG